MTDWVQQQMERIHQAETGQKGGPGSGYHGHAGRPGQVGGSASGEGGGSGDTTSASATLKPQELFDFSSGNLRSSDELADKFGLVEKRGGDAVSWDTNKKVEFKVEGKENEWAAWLDRGRGRQTNKIYMYISKRAIPTYPWGDDAPVYGDPTVFRAEYPKDNWKEYFG